MVSALFGGERRHHAHGSITGTSSTMELFAKLATWWQTTSAFDKTWLAIGLTGQLMFSARWILQWLASEKVRKSVVPTTFWYFSLVGGLMVLSYGIHKADPVIILGQFGIFIYARNIYLLLRGDQPDTPPAIETADSKS
jgi:lipid-A-disaccharide synthase-like uncharacterized protein